MNLQHISFDQINPAPYNPRKNLKPAILSTTSSSGASMSSAASNRWCGISAAATSSADTSG